MKTAYIAFGSNINPHAKLVKGLEIIIRNPHILESKMSSWYTTKPITVTPQSWYINGVLEVKTFLSPLALLDLCLAIEQEVGRVREFPNLPRVIDLDLLLYDRQQVNSGHCVIPHPRMLERRFVLEPLLQIAPQCQLPNGLYLHTYYQHVLDQHCEVYQPYPKQWF